MVPIGFVMTNADWTWVGLALGGAALWGLVRVTRWYDVDADRASATEASYAHIHRKHGSYTVYTPIGRFEVRRKRRNSYGNPEWMADVPDKWALRGAAGSPRGYASKQECWKAIQSLLRDDEWRRTVVQEANGLCEIRGPQCTGVATTVDYLYPPSKAGGLAKQRFNCRAACQACSRTDTAPC
jgi:hypothetical protein